MAGQNPATKTLGEQVTLKLQIAQPGTELSAIRRLYPVYPPSCPFADIQCTTSSRSLQHRQDENSAHLQATDTVNSARNTVAGAVVSGTLFTSMM